MESPQEILANFFTVIHCSGKGMEPPPYSLCRVGGPGP